jgi:hypothetical protein
MSVYMISTRNRMQTTNFTTPIDIAWGAETREWLRQQLRGHAFVQLRRKMYHECRVIILEADVILNLICVMKVKLLVILIDSWCTFFINVG